MESHHLLQQLCDESDRLGMARAECSIVESVLPQGRAALVLEKELDVAQGLHERHHRQAHLLGAGHDLLHLRSRVCVG